MTDQVTIHGFTWRELTRGTGFADMSADEKSYRTPRGGAVMNWRKNSDKKSKRCKRLLWNHSRLRNFRL
jgi:hypothetical protein